jgi:hypothetical protein
MRKTTENVIHKQARDCCGKSATQFVAMMAEKH